MHPSRIQLSISQVLLSHLYCPLEGHGLLASNSGLSAAQWVGAALASTA